MDTIIGLIALLFWLVFMVLMVASIVALWILFDKAGVPPWAAIIPVLNTLVLVQISGKPWWWIILMFVPFVNIVAGILIMMDFLKNYQVTDQVMQIVGAIFAFVYLPYIAFVKKVNYQPVTQPQFKIF